MDTDTRKFSAVNLGCAWRGINSLPAALLDEPEQFSLLYLYNEFAAEEAEEELAEAYVDIKIALKMTEVLSNIRSYSRLWNAIRRRTVPVRFSPGNTGGGIMSGQVDVSRLESLGVPPLNVNGKRVNGGV